jgi:hypothetical protein
MVRDAILSANAAGKGSQTARMWAWKRLKLRYLLDPSVPEGRHFWQGYGRPPARPSVTSLPS